MSPSTPSNAPKIPFQANPFTSLAVGSPWTDTPTDVASINDEQFKILRRGVSQVRVGNAPISIVVTGQPGSGKTHLLSRLKRYVGTLEGEEPWYIYVRYNASANTLWQHLQRSLAGDLLQTTNAGRLDQLIADPTRVLQATHLGLQRAFESLASGKHTLAASAWLRGEPLPDDDLVALGIGIEKEDEDRSRETEAKLVVEALLRWLSPTPVVLCFDQIEALETYPGEQAGYHAMGQMVSALVNGPHSRLLLISCIVAAFLPNLQKLSNEADQDRWVQEMTTLQSIKWESAVDLVAARLDSVPALKKLRQGHPEDLMWPLDEAPIRALFEETGFCLPRKLIKSSKAEFARQMGDIEVPQINVEDFLQQEYSRLLERARLEWRKQGGEEVLEDCLPWLLQESGNTVLDKNPETASYAQMAYRSSDGEAALLSCYSAGNSFTNRVKKALQNWKGRPGFTILSDPAIQPKPRSKGAEYLDLLKRRGARQIHPLPEAIAALMAIRDLKVSARSGELNLEGETVSEAETTAWVLKNLPPQLETLRDELIIKPNQSDDNNDPVKTSLMALLNQHKILEAERAGRELSLSVDEVVSCARRYPMHFGLLDGPTVVLFEVVEGSMTEEAHG
jgi:hypothetical protein